MAIRDYRVYTPIASEANSYLWRGKISQLSQVDTYASPETRRDQGIRMAGVNAMIDDTAEYADQQAPFYTLKPGRSVPSTGADVTIYLLGGSFGERVWRSRYVPGVGLTYDGARTGGRIIAPIPDEEAGRYPAGAAIYSGPGNVFNLLIPPTDWSPSHLESLGIYRARDALKAIPRGYITDYMTLFSAEESQRAIVENGNITVVGVSTFEITSTMVGKVRYRTGPGQDWVDIETSGISPTLSVHPDEFGSSRYWYEWATTAPAGSQIDITGTAIWYYSGANRMPTSCMTGVIALPSPVMDRATKYGDGDPRPVYRITTAGNSSLDSPHRRSGMGDITGRGFWPYVIWLGDEAVV